MCRYSIVRSRLQAVMSYDGRLLLTIVVSMSALVSCSISQTALILALSCPSPISSTAALYALQSASTSLGLLSHMRPSSSAAHTYSNPSTNTASHTLRRPGTSPYLTSHCLTIFKTFSNLHSMELPSEAKYWIYSQSAWLMKRLNASYQAIWSRPCEWGARGYRGRWVLPSMHLRASAAHLSSITGAWKRVRVEGRNTLRKYWRGGSWGWDWL